MDFECSSDSLNIFFSKSCLFYFLICECDSIKKKNLCRYRILISIMLICLSLFQMHFSENTFVCNIKKRDKSSISRSLWNCFHHEEDRAAFELSEYLYVESYAYIFIGTHRGNYIQGFETERINNFKKWILKSLACIPNFENFTVQRMCNFISPSKYSS